MMTLGKADTAVYFESREAFEAAMKAVRAAMDNAGVAVHAFSRRSDMTMVAYHANTFLNLRRAYCAFQASE